MDEIHRAVIKSYHKVRIQSHGNETAESAGWNNQDEATKRYELLLDVANMDRSQVLELGCGYGGILSLMDARYEEVSYLGCDLVEDFIHQAREKYADRPLTQFEIADYSESDLGEADFVIASGAFSYDAPNGLDHKPFYYNAIKYYFSRCRKAMAFNVLLSDRFDGSGVLVTYDLDQIQARCEAMTGGNFRTASHPDLPHEMTFYLYKHPA